MSGQKLGEFEGENFCPRAVSIGRISRSSFSSSGLFSWAFITGSMCGKDSPITIVIISYFGWCLYFTKLSPISKTADNVPRTGEYASNPARKNTPCISDLAGVNFFIKKERVFSFGVLPSKYSGSVAGRNAELGRLGRGVQGGNSEPSSLQIILFFEAQIVLGTHIWRFN